MDIKKKKKKMKPIIFESFLRTHTRIKIYMKLYMREKNNVRNIMIQN